MSQVDRGTSHSPSCSAPQSKGAGILGALSRRLLGRVLCSWAWVPSPFLTRQLPENRERWPGLGHMPDQNAQWTVRRGPPEPCGVECSWREGSAPRSRRTGGRAHSPQCPLRAGVGGEGLPVSTHSVSCLPPCRVSHCRLGSWAAAGTDRLCGVFKPLTR